MHARLAGWQSAVMAAAVLSSLVAGVVVARADAESSPESSSSIRRVPDVPATAERASGRAVDDPGAINALAGARVTRGCDAHRFCPTARVTREQLASFVVRALDT